MSDPTTFLPKDKENEERFRSPYERVEEMVRRVKPFVKVRRLVRIPKPRAWRRVL